MNSELLSNDLSAVETNKSRDGIRIRDGEWTGLMPYEDFPQFREANHGQVVKIEKPSPEQYSWPDLGIVVDRQTVENSQECKRGLKRMRLLALGLLEPCANSLNHPYLCRTLGRARQRSAAEGGKKWPEHMRKICGIA